MLRALPFGARVLAGTLRAKLLGQPDRMTAALAYVQQHAPAGDSEAALRALDAFAREDRFLMNVGPEKSELLAELVAKLGPGARVLELGAYCGYSALVISSRLAAGGRLLSIEKNPKSVAVASAVVRHAGLAERVEFREGDSGEVLKTLTGSFDLVFIDHWKGLYTRDLRILEERGLLAPGATVVADNVGPFFGADEYLGYVRGSGRYDTRYHEAHIEYQRLEDGVEVSVFRG